MIYDYIVVGSGFGGSVSALRLAEKGYSVLKPFYKKAGIMLGRTLYDRKNREDLLVHSSVKEELVEALKKQINRFYGENPSKSKDFTHIVDEANVLRLRELIKALLR